MKLREFSFGRASIAVFVTSAVVWLLELALPRVYSVLFDYHYTFLSISLTLSGLGLGAAVLFAWTRSPGKLANRFGLLAWVGVGCIVTLALLVTTTSPFLNLYVVIGLSVIPFAACGAIIAYAFRSHYRSSALLYAIDLAGAIVGIGLFVALSTAGALFLLFLSAFLLSITTLMVLAANRWTVRFAFSVGILLAAAALGSIGTQLWQPRIALQPGYHKEMYHLQEHPGLNGKVVATAWSAFGRTDLLASDVEPDRKVFFIDGSAGSSMYRFTGDYSDTSSNVAVRSLKRFPAFMGLQLIPPGKKQTALIIGPGGGRDIHLLRLAGFQDITAVEVNGDLLRLARVFDEFNGGLFTGKVDGIRVIEGEGRSFLRRSKAQYDLIYLSIPIIKSSRSPEAFSLTENFLFTQEAFEDYFARLSDDGRIIVVAHDQLEILKLALTAERSLASLVQPSRAYEHIYVAGAGMNPFVVFKKTPFYQREAELLHDLFMGSGNFNPTGAFFPFVEQHDAKILLPDGGSLDEPMLSFELSGLASGSYSSSQLVAASNQDIAPSDDDSPFFYNFQQGAPPVVDVIILTAGLLVMLVILWALRFNRNSDTHSALWGSIFFALGVGFMLIEIPLIQVFVLYLGKPIFGLTVVLASILLGGIAGSLLSGKIRASLRSILIGSSVLMILFTLGHMYVTPTLLEFYVNEDQTTRIATAVLMLLPLGVLMAVPFPTALRLAGECRLQSSIPAFWSVNGLASVLGAAIAVAVSITSGFSTSLIIASGIYGFVAIVGFRLR